MKDLLQKQRVGVPFICEMSISELKDHSEMILSIIQISCVLSFIENNHL